MLRVRYLDTITMSVYEPRGGDAPGTILDLRTGKKFLNLKLRPRVIDSGGQRPGMRGGKIRRPESASNGFAYRRGSNAHQTVVKIVVSDAHRSEFRSFRSEFLPTRPSLDVTSHYPGTERLRPRGKPRLPLFGLCGRHDDEPRQVRRLDLASPFDLPTTTSSVCLRLDSAHDDPLLAPRRR